MQEMTPEYVLQPHAISRAIYRLSATARKVIALGMAIIPQDLSSLSATFSYYEFCRSLGIEPGGETYRLLEDALTECTSKVVTIEDNEKWQVFGWTQTATINKQTNLITIIFSSGLAEYLGELKKMYARIELTDFGRLQSLYAIRYFELAKSYESLAGKSGNKKDYWFFERSIPDLRTILGIEKSKYTMMRDFRKYVIDKPIKELNDAQLGLIIEPDYIRRGKYLVGVRFHCEKNIKKVKRRCTRAVPPPLVDVHEQADREAEALKAQYPEEYAALYAAGEAEQKAKYGQIISEQGIIAGVVVALKAHTVHNLDNTL